MTRRRFFLLSLIAQILSLSLIAPAQQASESDVITGRVIGVDGNPVVSAAVTAHGPNQTRRTATTDDEGHFQLKRLPPGNYAFTVDARGYLFNIVSINGLPMTEFRSFQPGTSLTITLKKGGVITGRVTGEDGRPVVAVPMRLEYVRADDDDSALSVRDAGKEVWTDDRGIYRFFGLSPGAYLVRAGGRKNAYAYADDAPTYYPSARRYAAAEVKVRAGEETSGIDIRYRGERGYTISGTIIGAVPTREIYLRLNRWPGGWQIGFTSARVAGQSHRFEFEGIPDGEYELITRSAVYGDDYSAASPPRRVTIKGADVSGVEITLVRTTRSPTR
jgi:hypothetical protein